MKQVTIHVPEAGTLADHLAKDEHLAGRHARIWTVSRPGVVLGLRDTRLPRLEEATALLARQGFEVHVRASGGRLVVQDPGVLNVAFAYAGEELPTLEALFAEMTDLLARFAGGFGLAVDVGEVPGSICAGSSDLAVGGRKVAGLSQRRRRTFALVHAFILVEGTGEERLRTADAFYRAAGASPAEGVRPGTMVALSELIPVGVGEAAAHLAELLQA